MCLNVVNWENRQGVFGSFGRSVERVSVAG